MTTKTLKFRILLRKFLHQMASWFPADVMIRNVESGCCPFMCADCKYKPNYIYVCLQLCPKWSKTKVKKLEKVLLELYSTSYIFDKVGERADDPRYSRQWKFCSQYYNKHINLTYSPISARYDKFDKKFEKFMIKIIERYTSRKQQKQTEVIKKW
jgi:hypothetical protein